jgi:hypothetical protein
MTLALAPAALVRPRSRWWEPTEPPPLTLADMARLGEPRDSIPTPLPRGAGVWFQYGTLSQRSLMIDLLRCSNPILDALPYLERDEHRPSRTALPPLRRARAPGRRGRRQDPR